MRCLQMDYFELHVARSQCLHPTSSSCEMCTLSVSNVIYHKFSYGAVFYTLNGKNVNLMLEFLISKSLLFHTAVTVEIQIPGTAI